MGRLLPPSALLAPVARLLVRPGEDGAHMGGCFCIPGEPSLSWDPGEFPGGTLACVLAEVARPVKAQGLLGWGSCSSKDGEMVVLSGSLLCWSVFAILPL